MKRFLLAKLANGDWKRHDVIQVFIPPGVDFDRQQVLENLCTGLVLSLAGSLFSIYPRHRWLGADATVEQSGSVPSSPRSLVTLPAAHDADYHVGAPASRGRGPGSD